ncbi:MAG: YggT family protein [Rhodocyclaceae bacterium]|jgi:YggT family protein
MLSNIVLLVVEAVLGFFSYLLVARFYMQWARVPFRNQIGHFVVALTDWMVRPARRLVPGWAGLDLASLVLAFLLQTVIAAAEFWLHGFPFGTSLALPAAGIAGLGVLETLRVFVYLLIGVVLIGAVLSWVSPYSHLAPLLNGLASPFLRPIQRRLPTVANIDLSPLVLLLLLQIALLLLATARASLVPMIAG